MDFEKKRGYTGNGFDLDSKNPEERFLVDIFSQVTERLKQKYNYSDEEILGLWNNGNAVLVPVVIFASKLGSAEALTKFLKENCCLGYNEIAGLIGRDEKSVWANYRRAVKKMPWPFEIKDSIAVPLSIFNSEKSILESLVVYLREIKKMRNKRIAQLLNKKPSSVWNVHNRAKKKLGSGQENEK